MSAEEHRALGPRSNLSLGHGNEAQETQNLPLLLSCFYKQHLLQKLEQLCIPRGIKNPQVQTKNNNLKMMFIQSRLSCPVFCFLQVNTVFFDAWKIKFRDFSHCEKRFGFFFLSPKVPGW